MVGRRYFLALCKDALGGNRKESFYKIRPPYGLDESTFENKCAVCESKACVIACDEHIIAISQDGTPVLNFTKGGCTFCQECAHACQKDGAGTLCGIYTTRDINATFTIATDSCMAHHKAICFSCKEPCAENAILFNGMFNPVIDRDLCSGCGLCMQRCPTNAISYHSRAIREQEAINLEKVKI